MQKIKILLLIFLGTFLTIEAQETLVIGQVFCHSSKTPIPSVNVYFQGTTKGTTTDDDGFFMLRNHGPEDRLIFSSIGYKSAEISIRAGQTASVQIALREDINLLQELFVLPGANPALDLLRKVRLARLQNDIYLSQTALQGVEEQVVIINKTALSNRRLFGQLSGGLISPGDSMIFQPLFISEETYLRQGKGPRETVHLEQQSVPEQIEILMQRLTGELKSDINIYDNTITLFGKNFVSPISSVRNTYYRFFLIDSVPGLQSKEYYLRFRSKNTKNLAFNGELWIDSATSAVTRVHMELPAFANLNYVDQLSIQQQFRQHSSGKWMPEKDEILLKMNYPLLADSAAIIPDIFFRRSNHISVRDTLLPDRGVFAGTAFTKEEMTIQLSEMNDLPIMKTAQWLADVIITGYMNVGKLDIGKIYQLSRLSEQEGVRFTVPLRTNERLWENVALGASWGYGLRDKEHKWSTDFAWKIPVPRKTVLSMGFSDDLRRLDYDYNDFLFRENPLLSGDEDIGNTYFSFRFSDKLHARQEWFAALAHDWSNDVESNLYFRTNRLSANEYMPFVHDGISYQQLTQQSLSLTTRWSFGERTYEDHLQRIYIPNWRPVFYLTLEAGRAQYHAEAQNYAKAILRMRHNLLLDIGQLNYSIDAGWIFGNIPYSLLFHPVGSSALIYKPYHYNMMGYREYVMDRYVAIHNELIFNGIVFNRIPGIRHLNLRELVTFKALYGNVDSRHGDTMDFPGELNLLRMPYMEAGVGISNLLKVFTLQNVWRLSGSQLPEKRRWRIVAGIRFSF